MAPFVSGDAFRSISDWCYDEVDSSLNPASIQPGDTIFVKTDFLNHFFQAVHPLIPCKYILICHNSDDPAPGDFKSFLDDEKIIAWFGQNYDGYSHPKMHPIPMGIANFCWPHGNGHVLKRIQEKKLPKMTLAHMNFNVKTFPDERLFVQRKFATASYCNRTSGKIFIDYLADLAMAKFEIAPRGHALDTHRIWESLYLGTIPIVKTSPLDALYEGLPILIIQDWNQVTEKFLNKKYKEFSERTFNLEKTSMDYWIHLINLTKNEAH